MTDELSVAVVGCGARAQTAHLPYLRKNPHVKIAALCDRDEAKLAALKDRYAAGKIATSYNEILNDPSIDAVIITTPNYLHHPMVLAGLDYGKHVLVELPLALNQTQAKEMIERSRRKGKVLAAAHNDHFRPDVILMRQIIEREEIGALTYAKTGWLRSAQRWSLAGWRGEKLSSGGGAFLTLGIPLLDLALFALGERKPCSISGMAFRRNPQMEIEDSAVAQLRFEDDTVLVIEVSWILHEPHDVLYLNVYGTRGAALLNPLEIHKEMYNRLVNVAPAINKKAIYPSAYQAQINAFVAAAQGKKPFPVPLDDALLLTRLSDAFYQSVGQRKEIALKPTQS